MDEIDYGGYMVEMNLFNKAMWFFGSTLKSDSRNPYRYWCRKCDQRYDTYNEFSKDTLEPMGVIKDSSCRCHNYFEIRQILFIFVFAFIMAAIIIHADFFTKFK